MLGADAERLPDGVHLRLDVQPVDLGRSGRRREHAGQDGDGRGLPGAVVAKERGDLALVKVEAQVLDGHFAVLVHLREGQRALLALFWVQGDSVAQKRHLFTPK